MGVPNSEVGYTSATTGKDEHEVNNGHVVALEEKMMYQWLHSCFGSDIGSQVPDYR
jgi:hypothetical protein